MAHGLTATPVVVCGAGMAGLAAAAAAAEAGARVVTVEKGHTVGGSLALSGGLLWTLPSPAEAWEAAPLGDPWLQSLVSESFPAALAWAEGAGVTLGEDVVVGRGRGRIVDPVQMVAALRAHAVSLDVEIRPETALEELVTSGGRVVGVRTVDVDGEADLVDAVAVVVATGGFQGNPELLQRYVGVPPDHLSLRSNPWSTGDGLLACLAAGAGTSAGLDGFYGHAMAAPPATIVATRFRDATQFYGHFGVALDRAGRRFADESGQGEEALNQSLARLPGGVAYYVVDDVAARQPLFGGRLSGRSIVARATTLGARHVEAPTLPALCAGLARFGGPAAAALASLERFNHEMQTGAVGDPPRRSNREALVKPPFHAVEVKASITFTTGGLLVDEHLRVLRRAASSSPMAVLVDTVDDYRPVPIPGLFAAGNDVGGIHHGGYLGGLAAALTTGLAAGSAAAGNC